MTTLKCRPTEAEKEPIMVFMSSPQMLSLKLKNGDLCTLEHKDITFTAVTWLTSKADLKEGVIGVSKWLQEKTAIKLGNEIIVHKAVEIVDDTSTITLRPLDEIDVSHRLTWELTAAVIIPDTYRYLSPSQVIEFSIGRHRKKFEICGREGQIFKAVAIGKVNIGSDDGDDDDSITFAQIGGLNSQKTHLRRIIDSAIMNGQKIGRHTRTQHATGILLYGPSGTGKTLLRRALNNEFTWSTRSTWKGLGSKLPANTGLPTIIHLVLRRKPSSQETDALEELFLSLPRTTLIIAEMKDPNDLPETLRTSTAFMHEIEVPIPDSSARHEILKQLNEDLLRDDMLLPTAQRTHGYTGADLEKLLVQTSMIYSAQEDITANGHTVDPASTSIFESLAIALTRVRPSALQQVFLEKPNVRWSDIGGQESFKERLRNAVEWPLKYPAQMKAYGIPPKKGVLLYGPPGTGKTMLVKALATESDYNFLAVKGAELISMYVGESERATRDVFKKARAASPCIIFFDEIDAIARRASGSSELNVLTTLLNEMDGFEELKDVLVIAATNKPQSIDPALMRPGRFDNVVYIGPPDAATRSAIFQEHFKRNTKFGQACQSQLDSFVEMSEGMSGAEIVAVCQSASEEAFKRSIESPSDGEIHDNDILMALKQQIRYITPAMLDEFESWSMERAAA